MKNDEKTKPEKLAYMIHAAMVRYINEKNALIGEKTDCSGVDFPSNWRGNRQSKIDLSEESNDFTGSESKCCKTGGRPQIQDAE